jgi:formylglycine-generating enzyme required for sulfatase activity
VSVAALGRADLVRALVANDAAREEQIVELLGFHRIIAVPEARPRQQGSAEADPAASAGPAEPPVIAANPLAPTPFWQAERYLRRSAEETTTPPTARPVWRNEPKELPAHRSLAPWRELFPRLRPLIGTDAPTAELDIDKIVEGLSRARHLARLPRKRRRRLTTHLQVIIDRSDRLVPFWDDQDLVDAVLRRLVPPHRRSHGLIHEALDEPRLLGAGGTRIAYSSPPPGGVVLVLGDLGCLDHAGREATERWRRFGRRIAASNTIASALLPAPSARFPRALRTIWRTAPWERSSPAQADAESLQSRADRLLALASPAVRIEPGLLRALRRSLDPTGADAGTEADVWQHAAIASRSPLAASLHPEAAKQLRQRFATESSEVQQRALQLIRSWRKGLPHEIWFEEVLNLAPATRALLPRPEDFEDASRFFAFLHKQPGAVTGRATEVNAWLDRVGSRATAHGWAEPELAQAVYPVKQRDRGFRPSAALDPIAVGPTSDEQQLQIGQRGRSLIVTQNDPDRAGVGVGSLVGIVRSRNGLVRILPVDVGHGRPDARVFWASGRAPDWADDWGSDQYGSWVGFKIRDGKGSAVEQRLRWIPPGEFMMGSPEDEEGRFEDEGPQHRVTIAGGFWMFDTVCTEALWAAVMGESERADRMPEFPTTDVSWEDAQLFCARLNEIKPGLDLGLPSEAQWEYACRAGTQTPYNFGSEINRGLVNCEADGLVPVASLPPNPWGLYEMHGNVWEWCADEWHGDYEGAPVDGSARVGSHWTTAYRVIRSGSWSVVARVVRAAVRRYVAPADGSVVLGFRCARVQGVSQGDGTAPALALAGRSAERRPLRQTPGDPVVLRCDEGRTAAAALPRAPQLIVQTDRDELWLGRLTRPDWASAIGRDRFGLFTEIVVPGGSTGDVTQRLRWIPPGRFVMGSRADEEGRYPNEDPQHEVTLAGGFWLFDTPCTQALWAAVMGENPSRFKSPRRPVERVSFEDVRQFLGRLNDLAPGAVELSLPSEVQWEYACRAGTEAATYAGPLQILGAKNAPVLDAIAWYGGNSGVDYDLDEGEDSSGWAEKQYPNQRAGTRSVGLKAANVWGLYDMLGNVWEWCRDEWRYTSEGASANGSAWIGSDKSTTGRVVRGGSWRDGVGEVRAAFRGPIVPASRSDDLGFRCAGVQGMSRAN